MAKHIFLFDTVEQYNEKRENDYIEPWLSYTRENEKVNLNKSEEEKLLATPLTFEVSGASEGAYVGWKTSYPEYAKTIQYKKNDGEWTDITATEGGNTIDVADGDIIQFRGDITAQTNNAWGYYYNGFISSCYVKVYGNIMSMIYSTDFENAFSFPSGMTYHLCYLLSNYYGYFYVTDASNLILPATSLALGCYYGMFYGSYYLENPPKILPAMTLEDSCYSEMFFECTSLTTAPELPATTLKQECYYEMFQGCTSLTTAPELPAMTLSTHCYQYMFRGCTSLTTAPSILPATTLTNYCYDNMFVRCTSLTTAPELPAPTLVSYCYYQMFSGCSKLNYIKCLATSVSATGCKTNWVSGVQTKAGTFIKAAGISTSTWTGGINGIPSNWAVQDA